MMHLVRSTLCLMLAICLVGCGNAKQDSAGKFAKTNEASEKKSFLLTQRGCNNNEIIY